MKREKYNGPLDIELENLPAGVDASVMSVPAGSEEVSLALSVSSTAKPQVRSSLIEVDGGGLHTTNHIILRVLADDPEKLPGDYQRFCNQEDFSRSGRVRSVTKKRFHWRPSHLGEQASPY